MAQTLGFYRLEDLIAELGRRGIGHAQTALRCEALTRDVASNRNDMQIRLYSVVLTARDAPADEILACELVTGEGLAAMVKYESHAANLLEAKRLVIEHLEECGFEVLPGQYAHEATGRAECGLWRFDGDRRLKATDP